jgi:peptide deformylase
MALREIKTYPDPVLLKKAVPVDEVDEDLRSLIDDMVETMYASSGIGLAAPQVGVSKRLIIVDTSAVEGEGSLLVLMNPEILESEGAESAEEGCLSLPGFTAEVKRAGKVLVRCLDVDGSEKTISAEGLLARALQHEIDHLEGVLLLERASFLSREFYKKRIRKSLAKTG